MASVLEDVEGRLAEGQPLTAEHLDTLAATPDLVRLGMLGDQVRRRRHGDAATYLRVARLAAAESGTATWPAASQEVRLVGAPASAADAVRLAREVVVRAGTTPVTAWSLDDLEVLAGATGLEALAADLFAAGVSAIDEAPIDRLADPVRALTAVTKAGGLVARVTVRQIPDRQAALRRLEDVKALQKATGTVRVFAPLPSAPDPHAPSTGYDDARFVALARVWLDTVETIQVDWRVYGPKLAQVALLFGADDLDGVSPEDEADLGRRRAVLEEVRRNITAAGLRPVERNARWGIVKA